MNTKRRETMSELLLVMVTIIWGGGFIATELVIEAGWNTSLILTTRFIIAAITVAIGLNRRLLYITKSEWIHGTIAGVILFLAFYTQTLGQASTTVSNVAFITSTNVVMVPFISWAINRDRPRTKTILLTMMALGGIGILSFKEGGISLGVGDLTVLLCAFFFAMQIAYLEKATKESNPSGVNFTQLLSAALISTMVYLLKGEGAQGANIIQGAGPILFLGILSTGLCFFLQTKAQKHVSASKVGVILSMEGVYGGVFSIILGFESLSVNLIVGGAMIVGAAILMNLDFKGLKYVPIDKTCQDK